MNIKQKHLIENNSICFGLGLIVQIFAIAATFLYKTGRTFPTAIMLVVQIISLLVSVLGYIFFRKSEKCHYFLLIGLAFSYQVMLLGSMHTPYMWAFGVLIGIIVIIYDDARICLLAAITAVVENLVYVIVYYVGKHNNIFFGSYPNLKT